MWPLEELQSTKCVPPWRSSACSFSHELAAAAKRFICFSYDVMDNLSADEALKVRFPPLAYQEANWQRASPTRKCAYVGTYCFRAHALSQVLSGCSIRISITSLGPFSLSELQGHLIFFWGGNLLACSFQQLCHYTQSALLSNQLKK